MILMNSSVMTISFLIFLLFGSIVAKNFEEINVTSRDELGNTALHEACIFTGHFLYKAKLLIQRGADVNAKNFNGETPLHLSAKFGKTGIAEILVKNGANVNARRNSGDTPLHISVKGNKADIVRILVENGADINARNREEKTPIHYAAQTRNENIAKILIETRINDESSAALLLAITLGNEDIVRYMVENGANVNVQMQTLTPLHLAALSDKPKIIKTLLVNGANINAKDNTGETPVHSAVISASTNTIRILAENRADLDITNNKGLTPLSLALWLSELPTEKYHEYLWIASILQNAEEKQRERAKDKRNANEHKCLADVID